METALSRFDWAVIGVYLIGVMLIGLYASGRQKDIRDYFLGSRALPWWAVTLSIIATETSAVTYIGIPEAAYSDDWYWIQIVLGFVFGRIFVALFFIRVFYRFDVLTVYGFLERRFGNGARALAALCFLLGRATGSGVRLFAACLAVQVAAGLPITWAIAAIGALAIGYTLIGGLRAVVWTDCILGLTFIGGGIAAAGFLLSGIDGGLEGVLAHPEFAAKFRILHLGADAPGGGWAGFFASDRPLAIGLLGGFVLTLATHGIDQDLVQRMLSCEDARAGGRSLIASAALILPLWVVFLAIGSLLYLTHQAHPEMKPGAGVETIHYFPIYIVQHLPAGIAGIIFAGLLAAAISSHTSVLNALAAATISDFYRPFIRREASDEHYLIASRAATALWGFALIGIAMAFIGEQSLIRTAMKVLTYFYGAILGVFLLGIFTRRGTGASAVLGMLVSVPCVLLLQLRAFLEKPETAPTLVQTWLEGLPASYHQAIIDRVPLLGWPLWIVIGTAISFAVAAIGRQAIARRA